MLQDAELSLEEDISLKMKKRALAGYGIEYHKVNTCNRNIFLRLNFLCLKYEVCVYARFQLNSFY